LMGPASTGFSAPLAPLDPAEPAPDANPPLETPEPGADPLLAAPEGDPPPAMPEPAVDGPPELDATIPLFADVDPLAVLTWDPVLEPGVEVSPPWPQAADVSHTKSAPKGDARRGAEVRGKALTLPKRWNTTIKIAGETAHRRLAAAESRPCCLRAGA